MACGEDRRHALGSTKKEGLEVGSSFGTQGSGRAGRMRLSNGCFLQTKGIAAIKRQFFLCADAGLMATTPLARKRRDAGNKLERRGNTRQNPENIPTNAISMYSRANHSRCRRETALTAC